jgi:2-polyprenyl-3-methyl-5-hydroxy-6-metoxy-1,4-benzoquinol methylase
MATIYQTELAKYNDLVDDKKSDDLEFYAKLAESVEGAVQDLGCGTGRVAIDLARRGFNVIGVDVSWDNLRIAQQHLCLETRAVQDHLQLINSDIRYFSTPSQAKLIILVQGHR